MHRTPAIALAFLLASGSIVECGRYRTTASCLAENAVVAKPHSPFLAQTQGQHATKLLHGGVEHSIDLPALPEYLRVGSIFNQALLTAKPPLDNWYRIPRWLGGEWHRDQETIISTYYFDSHQTINEPKTITARETAQFGIQTDRHGDIWHCRIAEGGVADCGSYYSIALVASQEPIEVSEDEVVIRDRFTELHVAKETNLIILAVQAESLSTYRPMADGTLKTTVSVKFFEEDGSPKSLQQNVAYDQRTENFVSLNSYKGLDLSLAFKQFLLSNGKEELVPEESKTSGTK
jgi:hypothetical protein